MFESLEDAGVVDAMGSAACEENAACGRRLMAIGELYARRAPEEDVERITWAIGGHANVVAEISAALNISRGAAGQLRYAIDLRELLCTSQVVGPEGSDAAGKESPAVSR